MVGTSAIPPRRHGASARRSAGTVRATGGFDWDMFGNPWRAILPATVVNAGKVLAKRMVNGHRRING
jgi:hypothetical protein